MHKLLHQLVWSISPRIAVSSGVWIFHHPNPCRILSINMDPINGTAFRSWYLCPDLLLWPFNSLSDKKTAAIRSIQTIRRRKLQVRWNMPTCQHLFQALSIFELKDKSHDLSCWRLPQEGSSDEVFFMCSFLCVSTIEIQRVHNFQRYHRAAEQPPARRWWIPLLSSNPSSVAGIGAFPTGVVDGLDGGGLLHDVVFYTTGGV